MIEPEQASTTGMTDRGRVLPFRREIAPPTRSPAARTSPETPALSFTWEALERQLTELAITPAQKDLVATLVSATRKQAAFKPSEMVLREVLCIASVLMDETFHPGCEEGEMS
jgi:hypothetical protein